MSSSDSFTNLETMNFFFVKLRFFFNLMYCECKYIPTFNFIDWYVKIFVKPFNEQINSVQKMSKVKLNVILRHDFDYESIATNFKLNLRGFFLKEREMKKNLSSFSSLDKTF